MTAPSGAPTASLWDPLEYQAGRPRVLVIANRRSGRCGARWRKGKVSPLDRIRACLAGWNVDCDVHLSPNPQDTVAAARRGASAGDVAVVATGGDGTLRTVADGLVGSETPLGLVPMGTENVLARSMGIPLDLEGACRHLVRSHVRQMDVGRLGDQHFLCFAGIGFDAQVVEVVDMQAKEALGSMAYVAAALGAAWKHRDLVPRARLTVDGRTFEHEFWLILVGTIPLYGGQLRLTPRACPRDGLLDVCVFERADALGTLRQWMGAAVGSHPELPEVAYYLGREILVETETPVAVQLDGDNVSPTPARIQVVPRGVNVRF